MAKSTKISSNIHEQENSSSRLPQKKVTQINSALESSTTAINLNDQNELADYSGQHLLDGKYEILKRLEVVSGEADLYLCSDSAGRHYVAKVFRRKDSIKSEVFRQLVAIRNPNIANFIDYGSIDQHTIIILPYFKKGSLQGRTFSYEFIRQVIIPALSDALKVLHDHNIIHKDIKPSNIMMGDDERSIALIDFGISSVLSQDVSLIRTTTGLTLAYSAPETYLGTYLKESDYYSLGMTIYELYCGYLPFSRVDDDDLAAVASLMQIKFPQNFPEDLKILIQGLTYKDLTYRNDPENPNRRWGYDQIQKWLKGVSQPVPGSGDATVVATEHNQGDSVPTSDQDSFKQPYKFLQQQIRSLPVLIDALGRNWIEGKKHVGRGLLSDFFKREGQQDLASMVMDCEDRKVTDLSFFYLLEDLSATLKPDQRSGAFYWLGCNYYSLQDFATIFANQCIMAQMDEDLVQNYFNICQRLLSRESQKIEILRQIKRFNAVQNQTNRSFALMNLAVFLSEKPFELFNKFWKLPDEHQPFTGWQDLKTYVEKQSDIVSLLQFFNDNRQLMSCGRLCYLSEVSQIFKYCDDLLLDVVYRQRFSLSYQMLQKLLDWENSAGLGIYVVHNLKDSFKNVSILMGHSRLSIIYFKVLPPSFFADSDLSEINFGIVLDPAITDLSGMFANCYNLKSVCKFDTSKVVSMVGMFQNCHHLEFVPCFDTSSVKHMETMFQSCRELQEIPDFNPPSDVSVDGIACGCAEIMLRNQLPAFLSHHSYHVIYRSYGSSWTASGADQKARMNTQQGFSGDPGTGDNAFASATGTDNQHSFLAGELETRVNQLNRSWPSLAAVDDDATVVTLLRDDEQVRGNNIAAANLAFQLMESVGRVHINSNSAVRLFNYIIRIANPRVYTFTISLADQVNDLSDMFNGCSRLITIVPLDTSRITRMTRMFYGCSTIEDIPSLDTHNVTNTVSMFENCSNLITIPFLDTSRVAHMDQMFKGCVNLLDMPILPRNTVLSDDEMFMNCPSEARRMALGLPQEDNQSLSMQDLNINVTQQEGCLAQLLKQIIVFFIILFLFGFIIAIAEKL